MGTGRDDWEAAERRSGRARRGWPLAIGAGMLAAAGFGVAGVAVAATTTTSSTAPESTDRVGALTLPTPKGPTTSTTTSTTTTTAPSPSACTPDQAARTGNLYLSIPGITSYGGTAFGRDFDEISTVSFGATAPSSGGTGGQGGAARATAKDVSVTKEMTPDDLRLYSASLTGQHLATVVIRTGGPCSAQGTVGSYQTLTLSDVLVTSFSSALSTAAGAKVDTITFNYAKISASRTSMGRDGTWGPTVKMGYDSQTGAAS